jgi:hypothetical protein
VENIQKVLNRLGERNFEKEFIINPAEFKDVYFKEAKLTETLYYSLRDIVIPKAIKFYAAVQVLMISFISL